MIPEQRISRPSQHGLRRNREKRGRQGRCAECGRGDKIQEDCSTGKLLGTRQDGHRARYEGSNEANDGGHDRRLEQTRKAGKIPCPIHQSCELVEAPERIRESRGVHRFRVGRVQKDKKINVRRMHSHGQHMLKFWSKIQDVVALSSAEAEMSAAVKACQEVLEMMSLWKDVGETTRGHVMGDASAAIGIIRRMVLGNARHLNASWLWGPREGSVT